MISVAEPAVPWQIGVMRLFRPTFELTAPDARPWTGDKIGGLPTGIAPSVWPSCRDCGEQLSFIGQFGHDEVRLDLGAAGRVLLLWQCEHDPGMCDTWALESGANAAFVVTPEHGDIVGAGPGTVVHPEIAAVGWVEEDDGVPADLWPAYFNDAQLLALGAAWWDRGGSDTRLGGVPAWIQSADEAPGSPWQFVGQVSGAQRIDGGLVPGALPGAGIQRRVDGAVSLEPPPGTEMVNVEQWIVVDETGTYLPGPNFGDGGLAYVFLDRTVDPPAASMFWQCG